MDILDLFPDLVSPEPNSGCWLWSGSSKSRWRGGLQTELGHEYAHRYSWRLVNGEIPGDLFVLHRCDVSFCVNPDHLFLGDQWDNMADMALKDRSRSHIRAEVVREIRELYATGRHTQNAIAARYGIGQTTVSQITRGARRRYV